MEWIAPALVAVGGIITAIAAWQRAKLEREVGVSGEWKKFADGVSAQLERTRQRLIEVEARAEQDANELDAQQERIRELEDKERAGSERLLLVEREHETLRQEHETMRGAFAELEARFERYRKGVGLLIKQIVEHGLHPVWKPDEDNSHT